MTDKNMLLVYVTGEPFVERVSAAGNTYTMGSYFVKGSAPFPEEVLGFDDPKLPQGYYQVPYRVRVSRRNLDVHLDFKNAVRVEQK